MSCSQGRGGYTVHVMSVTSDFLLCYIYFFGANILTYIYLLVIVFVNILPVCLSLCVCVWMWVCVCGAGRVYKPLTLSLSVHPLYTQFSSEHAMVNTEPNPAFILKVFGSYSPIDLVAFNLPPFPSKEHQCLHSVQFTHCKFIRAGPRSFRQGDQLVICVHGEQIYLCPRPLCKQRLSSWIAGSIAKASTTSPPYWSAGSLYQGSSSFMGSI